MNPQESLVYWIAERERIREAKERGDPKPWSDNKVFQNVYFCNVRREDDRVTKWIRKEWSPENIGWDNYEYAMVLARLLNWPDTLQGIDPKHATPEKIFQHMEARRKEGNKVWGNAYVVTTHGLKMDKAVYLCERVLPAAYEALGGGRWRAAYQGTPMLTRRHTQLMELEGLASFMAAQVIADLKNTIGHPLYEAPDWSSWSAPGPGSMRGLNWFFGEDIPPKRYQLYMDQVANYLLIQDAAGPLRTRGRINMQDLQNCLCEYDKFMRVTNNEGRSKRKYPGV